MKTLEFIKHLCAVFTIGVFSTMIAACGDDATTDAGSGQTSKDYLVMRSCTISEGAEVDVEETTSLTLSYNDVVTVSANANVTLNGVKVTPVSNKTTKMSVDIPLALEGGQSYELKVAEGSFVSQSNANLVNPAFTLKFKALKPGEQPLPGNDAMALTQRLGWGWNLGNHFDTSSGKDGIHFQWGWWDGVTPTEALYKALAAAGAKTVRIPVTWGNYQGTAPDYTIESSYMEEVAQNVMWAKEAGLMVVLNTHHDEYWQDAYGAATNAEKNEQIKDRLTKTWRQIAERFKDEGDYLILESFNELNHNWSNPTSGELRIQNEWNQLVVDVIRATGSVNATRWIAVPSYQANPGQALKDTFVIPTDAANKIIVAVHCYDPYAFTLQDPLTTSWGNDAEKKNIVNLLNQLKAKFIDNNIPCYLGEYGCSRHENDAENKMREYYLEYFCRAAHFAGLAACLWDNHNPGGGPEHHAYFSHDNGAWEDGTEALVKTMIRALTSNDPAYTLGSIRMR